MKRRGSLLADAKEVARGWRWTHRPLVPKSVELPHTEPHDFPTAWARTEVARAARAALQAYALKPLIEFEITPRVEGLDVLGRLRAPVIFIANHSSHLDAPALLASLPMRRMHRAFPAAASDYFFTSLPKVAFSAIVINALPFDRKENPRQSLDVCRKLLETPGHILILFPEGTRTSDGTIGPFKPGVGFLTAGTDFRVVPCYLDGAFRSWPKGKFLPRPRKLRLFIGQPLQFRDRSSSRDDAIIIGEMIRSAVLSLKP